MKNKKLLLVVASLLLLSPCLLSHANAQTQEQIASAATRKTNNRTRSPSTTPRPTLKRIATLRTIATADGSRVRLTSDVRLDDYNAYRVGDRFNVLIPHSEAAFVKSDIEGQGFSAAVVEQRGDDVLLSFRLQPGATAHVSQNFNRLDVVFTLQEPATTQSSGGTTTTANAAPTPQSSGETTTTTTTTNKLTETTPASTSTTTLPAATDGSATGEANGTTSGANSANKPSALPATVTAEGPSIPATANPDVFPTGKAAMTLTPDKANPTRVTMFDKPPVIDGKLDEEIWKQAAVFKNFYQVRPGDNVAPTHPTEALIGYDSKFLYIAFRATDEPGKVRATIAKRDNIFDDDWIGLTLDTFNDQRKAYEFFFNPLGVQADGVLTEGQGDDFSIDVVMESKGVVTENGFTVEVAIPFKSLRYEAGKGKFWGVHFIRTVKHLNNERSSWMPMSRDNSGFLNQAGRITGLEGVSTERTLEVIPSLTISETGRRVSALSSEQRHVAALNRISLTDPGRFVNQPIDYDPGVTVKLGITPTITLDFAYNPDFAQVEADATVVTANQRFPIFFEEKRPFFLEGIDIFQTPLQVVHTRTIVDPDYAVKLTGKRGRNTFGLMVASDNAPGNYNEDERTSIRENQEKFLANPLNNAFDNRIRLVDQNALVGVLRLKRDVGKENSLGFIATTSNFVDKHNSLGGFDGRFRLNKQTTMSFQVLGTTTRAFFYDPQRDNDFYRTGNGFAYSFRIDKDGRNFGWNFDGQGRTSNYNADVGFTRRKNTNREGLFVYYNSTPKTKAKLRNYHLHYLVDTNFDWQGRIQNYGNEWLVELSLPRQSYYGFGISHNYERLFEDEFGAVRLTPDEAIGFGRVNSKGVPRTAGAFAGDDNERQTRRNNFFTYAGTRWSKKYSGNFFIVRNWGAFDLDFGAGPKFPRVSPGAVFCRTNNCPNDPPLDPGPGDALNLDVDFTYQPTNALRASIFYTKSRLVRRDTGLLAFDTNIYSLRSTYQFTRFIFARGRIDYETLFSGVKGQFLLGWTPNPGTSLYVGYNDDLKRNGFSNFNNGQLEPGLRRNGRTFFIKMSYLFRTSF
ncbi:MAG TPA: DUF5916 domain-containing protein [Pyrinomonadaceae bacterium]|jgi:hypothetical protein